MKNLMLYYQNLSKMLVGGGISIYHKICALFLVIILLVVWLILFILTPFLILIKIIVKSEDVREYTDLCFQEYERLQKTTEYGVEKLLGFIIDGRG